MGLGYTFKCGACGYEKNVFLGFGMGYQRQYDNLVTDIRGGLYGAELQRLLTDYPALEVDSPNRLYVCDTCGTWKIEPALDLYRVKEPDDYKECGQGELVYRPVHICPACADLMRDVSSEIGEGTVELKCPKCADAMVCDPKNRILWD